MTARKRRGAIVFLSALSVGLILGNIALSVFGYRAETQILDQWFVVRYQVFGSQKIDPRFVIVGVDAATVHHFGKPLLLWQKDLADLISKIKSARPAAVGLDFLISPKTEKLDDEDPVKTRLQTDAFALGSVCLDGPPVILVERYAEDEFSHTEGSEGYEDDQLLSPHEMVRDLLVQPNGEAPALGIANVPTDVDGTVRRYKTFLSVGSNGDLFTPSTFAFRLLTAATGEALVFEQLNPKAGTPSRLSWKGEAVPFLFDDSFLLNYPGPVEANTKPGDPPPHNLTFPIISALSIIEGKVPDSAFQDKIVIIAPTAVGLDDAKIVPGDPSYPGGAIHATVLNMFLTDSFISRPSWAWIGFCGLAGLLGAAVGRSGRWFILGFLGVCFVVTGFSAFALGGVWLPTIFPLLSYGSGSLLGYLERLFTVERDRARVRSTFARMVSPQVMDHVLKDLSTLRHGVRKEITVLFTDINGFTPICEKHEPEEVISMLSDYFSKMVDVIMKYDGYLKQYVGDEIMVIFGAPDDRDDHATRAVLTALEMRDVLRQAKLEAGAKPGFFDIKAGINTGEVVVGKVGPESRWEYAAVGDSVNLGARVMSTAQKLGADIGVSEATRQRFEKERLATSPVPTTQVEWTSMGVQSFKGKISQMEVFSINRQGSSP